MNASIFIPPVIKRCNGASLQRYFEIELSVLTLRKKTLVLKRPGQTNSGALYVPQEPPLGHSVAALGGPIVAYFDNMSRNHCNEAPLRGFLPSVRFPIVARRNPPMGLGGGHPTRRPLLDRFDSPSVRLDRVRTFPPSSLLLARADAALGPSAIECRPLSCGASWSYSL